jgi:hypothetical protein
MNPEFLERIFERKKETKAVLVSFMLKAAFQFLQD